MKLVIADTGPINYLILIGHIDVLPLLCEKIVLPGAVKTELASPQAPIEVRNWIANSPEWIEVAETPPVAALPRIHLGETAAIELAVILHADLLLMDDREGIAAAKRKGLAVTGTLGILDRAATRGLLDFRQAISKLRATTFRRPEAILDALLEKHDGGGPV